MHVLETALFANLLSRHRGHELPEQWRQAFDRPNPPTRPPRAAVIRALTGMFALRAVIAALSIVSAGPIERPPAGLPSDRS